MKCSFILSSFWCYHDKDLWFNTCKKIPHSPNTEYPSFEEDKAAQRKLGNLVAWSLVDGTVMIYIETKEHTNGCIYPDQGYFIFSDIENASEDNIKDSVRKMESECLKEDSELYKGLVARGRKYDKEVVECHVKCLAKGLVKNSESILRLIKER